MLRIVETDEITGVDRIRELDSAAPRYGLFTEVTYPVNGTEVSGIIVSIQHTVDVIDIEEQTYEWNTTYILDNGDMIEDDDIITYVEYSTEDEEG